MTASPFRSGQSFFGFDQKRTPLVMASGVMRYIEIIICIDTMTYSNNILDSWSINFGN